MAHEAKHKKLGPCLARIALREEAALAELYDATYRHVHAIAYRILGDVHGAEEVVSDVYMRVWDDPGSYDAARSGVLTWLLVLCRSRALDELRRRRRAPTQPEVSEDTPAEGNDPQDLLEATERNCVVRECVGRLQPAQRQLVALAFFRGYSHAEIASHTGLPLGTVKTHLRGAIGEMRAALTAEARLTA